MFLVWVNFLNGLTILKIFRSNKYIVPKIKYIEDASEFLFFIEGSEDHGAYDYAYLTEELIRRDVKPVVFVADEIAGIYSKSDEQVNIDNLWNSVKK